MPRSRVWVLLLLLGGSSAGCATSGPDGLLSNLRWSDERGFAREFPLDNPAELQPTLTSLDRKTMESEIARTSRGSLVQVTDRADRRFMGTLLSSERQGVVLLNCIGKDVIAAPDGRKQVRTSHRPFQSIESESITAFRVMAPPAQNWRADDPRGSTAEAVVLKSDRCLSCLPPAAQEAARRGNSSIREDTRQNPAEIPVGSRVSVVLQDGQQFQATLLSRNSDSVELMNCIVRETILDPWGHDQTQVSHIPFLSHPISSLVALDSLGSPPIDVPESELGEDCKEYIVAGFGYENGHYQAWGQLAELDSSMQETASPGVATVFLQRQ